MLTAGVDLAARPERTALVSIEWTADRAIVRDVACPADDTVILKAIDRADKTGMDCPLGWPAAFVGFVAAHHAGHVGIPEDGSSRVPGQSQERKASGPESRSTGSSARARTCSSRWRGFRA